MQQNRPDQTRQSGSLTKVYRAGILSLSLSVYTHTYSTIFHSNTPKQTPNCLQYFREMAKALRYFPCCPLEQSCVFISTKVEICIVERKEISFRREHKQKQVLIWSGSTDPSRINAKAEHQGAGSGPLHARHVLFPEVRCQLQLLKTPYSLVQTDFLQKWPIHSHLSAQVQSLVIKQQQD